MFIFAEFKTKAFTKHNEHTQMIKTIIITTILLILNWGAHAQASPTESKIILDSLEVLKQVGGFVDGISYPPTADETRYYNITKMLFALPFKEAKKLMADDNKFARAYGISIATIIYIDSLTKLDLELFNDTTSLPLYTQKGIVDGGITIGQFFEMAYLATIEERRTNAKAEDVMAAIVNFIKANSKYSESYEPIEFFDYLWGGDDDNLFFQIQHKYNLKQKDGKKIETTNFFILDKDFSVIMIETTRSNSLRYFPPELEEWTSKFGNEENITD